jgi:two-component system sensor histidine kinase/response regulator
MIKVANEIGFALTDEEVKQLYKSIYSKADKLTEGVLYLMFGFGLAIAFYYDTWLIAIGVGGLCMAAYFITKRLLPESNTYQYVLSAISAIFAAQYIYQMHGMAEMHFWVFISSTILIIYQNWKLQIPLILIVIIHHGSFAYLQYIGYNEIYFTQLAYMDLTAFFFHGVLASCVCLVAGIWSMNIETRTLHDALNLKMMTHLQQDLQRKNEELLASEEQLLASGEELKQINENLNSLVENRTQVILDQNKKLVHYAFVSAHKVRSPLARILGLVNLIGHEISLSDKGKELKEHLQGSANELDDVLREARINLDQADVDPTLRE